MKPTLAFVALFASSVLSVSCASSPTTSFKDDLRFGTGIDYSAMKVTGESTTFSKAPSLIAFRLESAANFDGRFVRLYLNGLDQKDFAACASKDAHICLSSFSIGNPGTYEVKAFLVQTVVDIGKETLVTSATITVR